VADWSSCNSSFPNNGGNTYDATISSGDPQLTSAITVGNVTVSSPGAWGLTGTSAAATLTGNLTNSGTVSVDASTSGGGGSSLTIGGTLTNSGAGASLDIGNAGLTASSVVTATGLSNSGTISLVGNGAAQAGLNITGATAPATWTGTANLSGNALLQFAGTSQIGAIGSGAAISINGPQAFVAAAGINTTSNSALSGLSSNAGTLDLVNGASVTTVGVGLTNTGAVSVDGGFDAGGGGSTLTLGGALTNSAGAGVAIGNGGLTASSTVQATSLSNSGRTGTARRTGY
jgi:fibronectin-binding autotransporter adhesin